jgi:hypothetical protein
MEYELHKTVTLLLMGDEFYANLPDVVDVREAILPTSPAEG